MITACRIPIRPARGSCHSGPGGLGVVRVGGGERIGSDGPTGGGVPLAVGAGGGGRRDADGGPALGGCGGADLDVRAGAYNLERLRLVWLFAQDDKQRIVRLHWLQCELAIDLDFSQAGRFE
jgi:hypothetical protein